MLFKIWAAKPVDLRHSGIANRVPLLYSSQRSVLDAIDLTFNWSVDSFASKRSKIKERLPLARFPSGPQALRLRGSPRDLATPLWMYRGERKF